MWQNAAFLKKHLGLIRVHLHKHIECSEVWTNNFDSFHFKLRMLTFVQRISFVTISNACLCVWNNPEIAHVNQFWSWAQIDYDYYKTK